MSVDGYRIVDRFREATELLTDYEYLSGIESFENAEDIDHRYVVQEKKRSFNPWHMGLNKDMPAGKVGRHGGLQQAELELAWFLFALVVQLKPRVIVETGTNVGFTTRALGAGCRVNGFGRVVSAEIDSELVAYARKICENVDEVEIRQCPALELPELLTCDLAFIDSIDESRVEEIQRMKPGSVYIFHDTLLYAYKYRKLLDEETYRVHLDSPRGFTIVRKP